MSDQRAGGIAWTDQTWNPIRGCSRVSEGCRNCYAEGVAARFSGPGLPFEGLARRTAKGLPQWTGKVRMVPERMADPLRWKRPRRVFVNSVSDLFHEGLSNEQIAAIFGVMAAALQHTFQVLTKRPRRMWQWFRWIESLPEHPSLECAAFLLGTEPEMDGPIHCKFGPNPDAAWPLPNVWLGVSVEDQKRAEERIPYLLDTPAAVRWVSAEPLLERVELFAFLDSDLRNRSLAALGSRPMPGIDWVVVGGESGNGARLFDPNWAYAMIDACRSARTPIFVKQMGANAYDLPLKSKKGGDPAEWPEDLRVQQFPRIGDES
jgi:protein gp37